MKHPEKKVSPRKPRATGGAKGGIRTARKERSSSTRPGSADTKKSSFDRPRPQASFDRGERPRRATSSDRGERPVRTERGPRADRGSNSERPRPSSRYDRSDRPGKVGSFDSGERPRRASSSDSGERPRREGSFDRAARPRPEGSFDSGERPRRAGSVDRAARPRREGSYDSGERPRREGSFDRGERPRRASSSDRGERPRREGSFDRVERPRREGSFDRGDRPRRASSSDRGERPRRASSFGRGERPRPEGSFDRGERPRRAGSVDRAARPRREGSYDSGERPRREGSFDRGERPRRASSFDRGERPRREGSFDRGERPRRASSSDRGERPARTERAPRVDRGSRVERAPRRDRGSSTEHSRPRERQSARGEEASDASATWAVPDADEPVFARPLSHDRNVSAVSPIDHLRQLDAAVKQGDADSDADEDGRGIRINRFLAMCGLGSRRQVEEFIVQRRVRANGAVIEDPGYRVQSSDLITVDGKHVNPESTKVYVALNKPAGYVVSRKSYPGNPSIYEILPEAYGNLGYAGRLDRDSRGLVILSSDGAFIQNISHPRLGMTKTYHVTVDASLDDGDLAIMTGRGVKDEDEVLRAISVKVLDRREKRLEIVLGEGKNRQIRRMLEALRYEVVDLQRVAVGHLSLANHPVKEGEHFVFNPDELLSGLESLPESKEIRFRPGGDA